MIWHIIWFSYAFHAIFTFLVLGPRPGGPISIFLCEFWISSFWCRFDGTRIQIPVQLTLSLRVWTSEFQIIPFEACNPCNRQLVHRAWFRLLRKNMNKYEKCVRKCGNHFTLTWNSSQSVKLHYIPIYFILFSYVFAFLGPGPGPGLQSDGGPGPGRALTTALGPGLGSLAGKCNNKYENNVKWVYQ